MSEIIVALTFDGGPDGVAVGGDASRRYNTTERVLEQLLTPRVAGVSDIRAAFFVQTHVPGRMAAADGGLGSTPADFSHGQVLVKRIAEAGLAQRLPVDPARGLFPGCLGPLVGRGATVALRPFHPDHTNLFARHLEKLRDAVPQPV